MTGRKFEQLDGHSSNCVMHLL